MRILALSTLTAYAKRRPDSAKAVMAWYTVAAASEWRTAAAVKDTFAHASIINAVRIVFNLAGNKHRLIVAANYRAGILFIQFIGTHAEYDRINAATVQYREDT